MTLKEWLDGNDKIELQEIGYVDGIPNVAIAKGRGWDWCILMIVRNGEWTQEVFQVFVRGQEWLAYANKNRQVISAPI